LQLSGKLGGDIDGLARDGVGKREPARVEKLPLEAQPWHAVCPVSHHGKADRGQVDADLVRAARLEPNPQQRVLRQDVLDVEVRDGVARRAGVDGLPRRIISVAADGRLDSPATRTRPAPDERKVLAFERAPPDEALQAGEGILAAGDDEQARRIPVEAVDDARSLGRAAGCAPSAERPGERPPRMTCPGMDYDSGGLLDDEQVLVLPGDVQARRLGFRLRLGRSFRWLEPNLLTAGEAVALRPGNPVYKHFPFGDEPLRGGAGTHGGLLREEPIQPQPCGGLRYAEGNQERSVDAPCRRRGLRSPASIVPTRSTTPTTMHPSAMLKAGQ
jgi:hypothetical protein